MDVPGWEAGLHLDNDWNEVELTVAPSRTQACSAKDLEYPMASRLCNRCTPVYDHRWPRAPTKPCFLGLEHELPVPVGDDGRLAAHQAGCWLGKPE